MDNTQQAAASVKHKRAFNDFYFVDLLDFIWFLPVFICFFTDFFLLAYLVL